MRFTLATAATTVIALTSSVLAGPIEARNTGAYLINVVNQCSQTIWPGLGQTLDSPASIADEFAGFELTAGASRMVAVPANWVAGRVFGRTGCSWNNGVFSCEVGDCGALSCSHNTGVSGVSLVEFSYSEMQMVFYNLSLVSGYNLPIKVTPSDPTCSTFTCGSAQCSDSQAYQPWSSKNPCMGCALTSGYTVTFCPS